MTPIQIAGLRRSLTMKLRAVALSRGVGAELVRKQYVFVIFLAQLFRDQESPWVLLGGNALLMRTGGGRFTQDVDLARERGWGSAEEASAELQRLVAKGRGDSPFAFHLMKIEEHPALHLGSYGSTTAKISVEAKLGGVTFERFSIDISPRRHSDAPADQVQLSRIIDDETLDNLPTVPTTPVEPHLADKICAMYERHGDAGDSPSTRYRDLADVVRIVQHEEFDAARLRLVLRREAVRRRLILPVAVEAPHPVWEARFPVEARKFSEYPEEFHPLGASLRAAGDCLNGVLDGSRTQGRWEPRKQRWT